MKNLILHLMGQLDAGDHRHAQQVMRDLGITYVHATPQSLFDCWQFWGCKNIPATLPPWIETFDTPPEKFIGNGLSAENVAKIAAAWEDKDVAV